MKTFKKSLSLILAVCMIASMAAIATVTASANSGDPIRRPLVTDVVNKGAEQVETNTYYFYMPTTAQWRNEFNDYYKAGDETSYAAGIYWWDGSYGCNDNYADFGLEQGWPGYAVTEKEAADANIFKAEVPKDVPKIIWNNLVDGGQDASQPQYTKAAQTMDIPSEYYDPDEEPHGFYPNGTTSFDGMIFVPNPKEVSINPLSQKETIGGSWCYYYGDGTYGIYPTKAEAEAAGGLLSNGQFPAYGLQTDCDSAGMLVGKTATITPNDSTAVATIADPAIASVTQDAATGAATVTGLKAGKTTLVFTLAKDGGAEEKVEVSITVTAAKKANPMKVTTVKKTVKAKALKSKKQTVKGAIKVTKAKGTVTYAYNKSGTTKKIQKMVSVDKKKGTITLKKGKYSKGTYTVSVKVTAKGNKNYKSKTVTAKAKITIK